jgi:Mn-dependent DtxR family transcriptional regulator
MSTTSKAQGIYLHKYASTLLESGRITAREAILLAIVDNRINAKEPRPCITSLRTVQDTLRVSDETVRSMFSKLVELKVLRVSDAAGRCKQLRTKPRRPWEVGSLLLPFDILDLFRDGKSSPKETILLAIVRSFTRNDRECFVTNSYLGKRLHISGASAKRMVAELRHRGLLHAKYRALRRYLSVLFYFSCSEDSRDVPDDDGDYFDHDE